MILQMKKLLALFILAAIFVFGSFYFRGGVKQIFSRQQVKGAVTAVAKQPILRIGLVADSENDNEDLKQALVQLKSLDVKFVIGLGDWSSTGTIDELARAKEIFEESGLGYYLTPGDHDLWDSRNRGEDALANYNKVFGGSSRILDEGEIRIVIVDNSDIYKGISQSDWEILNSKLQAPNSKLTFVFAHKTPFHPESAHIMGEDNAKVAGQAKDFLNLLQIGKVDGFFSGDMHFFAKFNSPDASVKMTTIGAVEKDRNFQGPRFGVLTVFSDYSWEVNDIEIQ